LKRTHMVTDTKFVWRLVVA